MTGVMEGPPRPQGVRVVVDGREYPVDDTLRFEGYGADGCAEWVVFGPEQVLLTGPPGLRVEVLPGRTAIRVSVVELTGPGLMSFAQPEQAT